MIFFEMARIGRDKVGKQEFLLVLRFFNKIINDPEAIDTFRMIGSGIVHQKQIVLEYSRFSHILSPRVPQLNPNASDCCNRIAFLCSPQKISPRLLLSPRIGLSSNPKRRGYNKKKGRILQKENAA